ncbi:Acyl-CoA dehydrogenase [Nakamurella panacisegetis]|uniref:Acyl-CoA dehydrogenase n=1 Tax=Nakamurella panacisegetis TaxID=1090615 RepID=A0A1H0LCK5_9ACTN|nr:acyl-CoA dehydrogenase family protein [Nakamurella panacisegetis]SDO65766.1 Acyl-CoA dehydrogenase [Nakamurella panacisegetis]
MSVVLTAEQQEYQLVLHQFLERQWPQNAVFDAVDGKGARAEVWQRLVTELDVAGLAIPEEYGGLGLSQIDVTLAAEELGAVLYCGPWFGTVALGVNALLLAADRAAAQRYLPAIARGERTATLAFADVQTRGAAATPVRAKPDGEIWRLSGVKDHVVDGATAELLLVVAETSAGPSLFAVEDTVPDTVTRRPLEALDPTRPLARVTFTSTPAMCVGQPGSFDLQAVLDLASVSATAEVVGGAAACIRTTVAHVLTRQQFGRPIGSFQAVKHRLADMQLRLEASRSALRYLAQAIDSEPDSVPLLAAVAFDTASAAYFRTAADTIQLHGGIGFTWEHVAHLHFKRAKSLQILLGASAQRRRRIADAVLGTIA